MMAIVFTQRDEPKGVSHTESVLNFQVQMHGNLLVQTRISGFRRHVDEICALLGYYAALSSSSVPTFRDNLSVTSSKVKKIPRLGPIFKGLLDP
jgi:hypothetical protein